MALQQIGLDAVLNNVPDFTGGIDKMNKAVDSFASNSKKHGDAFAGGFGEIVTGALRHIGELAVDALMKAGQAVTGFIKDSIGLAGDFEQGMLNFQAVAGQDVDAKGLEEFRDLFIDIGKRLPVSTTEVQQAATELVKGGIEPATVAAGGLESSIKFAAAAMDGDLVGAAEISAKIVGGWADVNATAAEKADLLTRSQDQLTKTANAATVGVDDLSLGLFNSQGNAKLAGIGFDDLTTTLALITPNFSNAGTAGTSLNAMIARLQPSTKPATAAMEDLGLWTEKTGSKFYDAQGNFVGWATASQMLQDATKNLTDAQKQSYFQTIFGMDAQGAAAELTRQGAAGWENMAEKIAAANGVQENAAIKQAGFNTALDNAKGSVEALRIQLGSFLLPILTDLLDNYISPGINALSDFAESFMKMVPAIQASDDPLQTFLNALKVAAPQFLDIISGIEDFKDGLMQFVEPARAVAAFIGDNLQPILAGLALALTVAVVPAIVAATTAFLAAAAPVVALVAAGALLYKAWSTDFLGIKTTVTAVWNDTLLPAFKDIQAWLAEKIPPAIKTLSDFWTNTLVPALKIVGDFFTSKVFPILSDLTDVFIAAAIIEVKALAALWENVLQPALKIVWDFITSAVIPIFKALFEVQFAIAAKVVEALAGLWQKVLWPALQSVGNYITTTIVPAFQAAGDYLSKTFGPALEGVKNWLDKVTGGFGGVSGAVSGVVEWLGKMADKIANLKLPDWLTPGSPTPWEIALLGIGKALSTSVAPGLDTMQAGVAEIGEQIEESFADTDLIATLTDLGKDAMAGFGKGLLRGIGGVIDVIESTASTVEDAFNDAFGAHSPATRMIPTGVWVIQGIMQGMSDQIGPLTDLIGSISEDLISQMEDIGSQIQNAIADSFGATASIDRQIAKNLDRFKDVLPQYAAYTEGALAQVQQEAEAFADPAEGAKWFKMRSDQILDYAKLQKQLSEAIQNATDASNHQVDEMAKSDELRAQLAMATTDKEREAIQKKLDASQAAQDADIRARRTALADQERIQAQMLLINRAQSAELAQFEATKNATSPMMDIAAQINEILRTIAGINLTDEQIHIVDMLATMLGQLQSPVNTRQQQYANPPSSTTNSTTLNMPIYTNNSPAALQQSMAIAGAALL